MPSSTVVPQSGAKNGAGQELDISTMNPDADGDGHISKMEREIFNALKAADVDDSGSIGVKEVRAPSPPSPRLFSSFASSSPPGPPRLFFVVRISPPWAAPRLFSSSTSPPLLVPPVTRSCTA